MTNNLTRKVTSIKIKIIYLIWLWQFYMLRVGVLYKTNTGNNLPFFKGKICFILLNTWNLKTYFLLLIKSMCSFVLSQSSFLVTLPYHKHMPYLTWLTAVTNFNYFFYFIITYTELKKWVVAVSWTRSCVSREYEWHSETTNDIARDSS